MAEEILSLFSTPVLVDKSEHADQLNGFFRPLILDKKKEGNSASISNVGGWHSSTDMVHWGGEGAKALVGHVMAMADKYTKDIVLLDGAEPRHIWYPEMWANVNRNGDLNLVHAHPGAFWSAVYYVDDGYAGSNDANLGGYLELEDPRMPAVRMADPDLRFRWPNLPVEHHIHRIRPESGMLVMFPSWLNHSVSPYQGKETRISIAINLSTLPASSVR